MAEGAEELGADALGADAGEVGGFGAEGSPGGGFDAPLADGGKADGAQEAEAVFAEAAEGVADGAQEAGAEVVETADVVDDLLGDGVVEEGVDGEVAALGVVLGGGVGDGGGVAAILVAAVGAEGGHIVGDAVQDHEHHAEGLAHANALGGEEGGDLLGGGGGGDVDVFDGRAAEGIAHAATGEVGREAVRAQGADDYHGTREEVFARREEVDSRQSTVDRARAAMERLGANGCKGAVCYAHSLRRRGRESPECTFVALANC